MANQLKNGIPPAVSDGKGRISGLARKFLQELADGLVAVQDVLEALSFDTISGTVPIAKGGTGQVSALTAFNALDPLTTKGDLIAHDGTNSVRQAVGANNTILVADSAQTNGIKWLAFESLPHGERVRVISSASGIREFSGNATWVDGAGYRIATAEWFSTQPSASADSVIIPLDLLTGERIKLVKMYGRSGGSSSLWTLKVFKKAMTSAAASQLGATKTSTNGGSPADDNLTSDALTETVVTGTQYYAEFATSGVGTAERRCYGVELTYDRP